MRTTKEKSREHARKNQEGVVSRFFSSIVFHFHVPCHELARAQQAVKEVAEQAAHLIGERKCDLGLRKVKFFMVSRRLSASQKQESSNQKTLRAKIGCDTDENGRALQDF